ncbi:uncharacterized protein K452DRAFT_100453 [Aplosporella prunicola CBS 121167]|uniref:Secreted protein n=1 Tax=Aplosporella prunicola CBS 121167 TaxID=1176127 RepID=A0A6A6B1F8_9PEZI|nr:uncharacterized protein K452DRAFT_100453 [Aplosporella prunicola CBS 121167]KAF2137656.1 hypothetical protein K452DRAFT_100453 [Aplosporella prunicola CBS 121167]
MCMQFIALSALWVQVLPMCDASELVRFCNEGPHCIPAKAYGQHGSTATWHQTQASPADTYPSNKPEPAYTISQTVSPLPPTAARESNPRTKYYTLHTTYELRQGCSSGRHHHHHHSRRLRILHARTHAAATPQRPRVHVRVRVRARALLHAGLALDARWLACCSSRFSHSLSIGHRALERRFLRLGRSCLVLGAWCLVL